MATRGGAPRPASAVGDGTGRAVAARAQSRARAPRARRPRIAVRKTYKLYIGGAFPRTESGRSYLVSAADGTPLANACRASRKDLRDAVRAARKAARRLGGPDRDEPRPGAVPRGRADGGPARPVRRRGRGRRGAARRQAPARSSTAPSTAGSGTPAGPTRSPRCSARPTRSPRRTSTSRSPSRPASSASSRRRPRRCSGWSAASRRRSCSGNAVVLLTSRDAAAARGDPQRGARHLGRARRRGQRPDRPQGGARAGHRRARRRRRDRHVGRARRPCGWTSSCCRRRHQAHPAPSDDASPTPASTGSTTARAERPEWIAAFLEMKTVWHPIGV